MSLSAQTPQALNARPASFWSQLQPASFRGVPFGVTGGKARFGRRNAVHEYPFRDVPWIEDLGRQSRRIQMTGFLVGDDVIARRARLIAACEKPGDGELIHPTLGRLQVALMDVSTDEHKDTGRVFEINFTFMEQGERQFPGAATSSAEAIDGASAATGAAATKTWSDKMKALAAQNAPIALGVYGTVGSWVAQGNAAVNSATGLVNLATSAVGNFGRLLGQASGAIIGAEQAAVAPLESLFGAAAALRQTVASVANQVLTLAPVLEVGTLSVFAGLSASYAAAVKGACFTPADALRSLAAMTILAGPTITSPAGEGTADLCRRLAVCQLAIASGAYQPSTAQEAVDVRAQVLGYIDAEILLAGDQGDDEVYAALRGLRAQTILDMNAKGARLPTLITVTTPNPVPSLTLAQRLYRDEGREGELVRRANPRHPAFMPVSFSALAT